MRTPIYKLWCLAALTTGACGLDCSTVGYDYIVVGGGTAGAAIATLLSQGLPKHSILLIEAGPSALSDDKINIPGLKGSTLAGRYDWNFTTTAQAGANDRVISVNRGKVLGGSSALNLMTWDRASAPEYDAWETLGNPGWNWESMIAAMQKAETFTMLNADDYDTEGVGFSGPVNSVVNREIPEHQKFWVPAVENFTDGQVEHNLNSLGGNPLGVMNQPSNIDAKSWVRSYSANAYLPGAGSNLVVLTDTRVAKVNMDNGSPKTITGVTLQNGTVFSACKEVILSAGSIQSPGLLELSGIGNSSLLTAAGINPIIDLPGVGENLQDHVRFQASFQLKPEYRSFDILRYNTTFAAEQMALSKSGQPSLYDYTGSGYTFMNWRQAIGDEGWTNMQNFAAQALANESSGAQAAKLAYLSVPAVPQLESIFSDGYTGVKGYPAPTSPLYGQGFFTLISVVMQPLSRGDVHITSSNVSSQPLINPNYLSNEHDLQAAVHAAQMSRQLASAEPLRSAWVAEYEPGSEVQTDEQWRDYVKNSVLSIFHPVGTCAMLPEAYGGVVDPKLKVYGTNNLRVVDASIMPVLLSAHIQTAVYGIAERAAEFIIADAS
ncbi:uncharacterized protein BCR38DRAFT_517400 [Pseudomassariella vexata]|uniref:Glucose-methanol-choline oxidoreductase N-terminal domain-containing protein n=1 Tax=Pseudomassariella vexata TaxID=1141098 RepID=A0A1Y2DSJ1_9PEZI|nr:uncharacterized protein BCR38DRAFT_517400 [Pseudomassariella vexata]ORY62124.1 hypothetical protein BCR38DRAFT_517400 [Pseudomassariella vexata]